MSLCSWLPDHAVYYVQQLRTFVDPKFVPTHSQMLVRPAHEMRKRCHEIARPPSVPPLATPTAAREHTSRHEPSCST